MLQRIRAAVKAFFSGTRMAVGAIRSAMRTGGPGGWASDHREEAMHVAGWQYVAIRAKCIQAMQATCEVYSTAPSRAESSKLRRRMIRKSFGSIARYKALYNEEEDETTPLPPEHPLVELLKRPNPQQSGAMFRFDVVQQLESTGTALVWNVPNMLGRTVERYVIPTAIATPIAPSGEYPRGGWRIDPTGARFAMTGDDGFVEMFGGLTKAFGGIVPAEQVQAIRWPHPIYRDDGFSPMSAGAQWIDAAEMIDMTRHSHLRNRVSPSVIIECPPDLQATQEELDAASAKFNEKYSGPDADGKAMFVTAGNVTVTSANPRDMDYIAAFDQLRAAGLALHGVTPIAAGITEGGSYAAFFAALKGFTLLTVQPILDLLAEEDTEFLAPQFGEGITIEYEAASIDDPTMLEARLANDLSAKVLTKGEWRALRGMAPFGDERDDELVGDGAAPEPFGGFGAFGQGSFNATEKPESPSMAPEDGEEEERPKHNGHRTRSDVLHALKTARTLEDARRFIEQRGRHG